LSEIECTSGTDYPIKKDWNRCNAPVGIIKAGIIKRITHNKYQDSTQQIKYDTIYYWIPGIRYQKDQQTKQEGYYITAKADKK
jgi:hypothetical protein